jgi:membrane fusion protein, copper/silver efflux system
MRSKQILLLLLVAALAGAAGWLVARQRHSASHADQGTRSNADVIYTCSMHPQVRQKGPGTCPFCGMALAPLSTVGTANLPPGSVMLSSNRVNVINVQTAPVQVQPLRRTLRVSGVIDDNDARHHFLSAYVDGRIDRLFVNYVGAEVKQGQPVALLFSPMLIAAEREYISLLRRTTPAQLPAGREDQTPLLAGARQRLVQLGLSEPQIAALASKPENAIHTELLAPASGTVVNRMVYEGQYVKEGDKLFEMADFSTMWFRFDAYERDLVWLQPGQMVDITTPSVPGKVFQAPIAFIDPNLNEPTRSAKVRVEIPNPQIETNGISRRELLHRLYAEGMVNVSLPEVLAVPRSAVLAPGRPYVFVDQGGGVYEQRLVRLGRAGDDLWEVLEGVQAGERVVTTGNLLIDAQAQLDNGGMTGGHEHGAAPAGPEGHTSTSTTTTNAGGLPALTDAQREVVTNFLAVADALTAALAADKVDAFNQQAAALHSAVGPLTAALTNGQWRTLATKVASTAHLPAAGDLQSARKAFHPFTMALADLGSALRKHGGISSVRVFQCPMVKQAFPGAPRSGRWIQLQPEIHNPYFGAEMLDCGTEVKD